MGVYIKDMKMPESCGKCDFNVSSLYCKRTRSEIDRDYEYRERLSDCPISALPDKHGRLIDENEVRIVMNWLLTQQQRPTWNDLYHSIQEMNAVIEAEEKEDA
jgi:hypothetical protein